MKYTLTKDITLDKYTYELMQPRLPFPKDMVPTPK